MQELSKRELWLQKRCTRITASNFGKLMSSGRVKNTLGKPCLDMITECRYGLRTGKGRVEQSHIKNFDHGHDCELIALGKRRADTYDDILHCEEDYDNIVFNEIGEYFGDSPDFEVYRSDELIGACEVKSPVCIIKLQRLWELDKIDSSYENYWQLIGHMVGNEAYRFVELIIYDSIIDEIKVFVLNRIDHLESIELLKERMNQVEIILKG